MASLDDNSSLIWKEKLYSQDQSRADGHQFAIESLRLSYMEGKVGYRESVALMNNPPTRLPGSVSGQGT